MTKRLLVSLGLTTALLAACNKPAEADSNAAIAAPAANVAAPAVPAATPAAAPAAAGAVTAEYMVGKWSAMGEDCADTLEFRKDGSVATPIGDAKWTLTGDQLAVDFGDGSKQKPSTIKTLGPDRIEITKESGGKETQKRC